MILIKSPHFFFKRVLISTLHFWLEPDAGEFVTLLDAPVYSNGGRERVARCVFEMGDSTMLIIRVLCSVGGILECNNSTRWKALSSISCLHFLSFRSSCSSSPRQFHGTPHPLLLRLSRRKCGLRLFGYR